ncbi:MAG: leucine-rich repeat protein [Clostridia bacterium]|nr:leucine-rich repeat protein [Clostridia bacterium]
MKKALSLILMFALIMSCCVFSGVSASAAEEDFTYKALTATTAEITGYTGSGGNVTLPSSWGDLQIVGIASKAFYQNKNLKEVTIPEGITYIGEKAFAGSFITGVKMSESVTTLGNSAFGSCVFLIDVTISKNIKTLSNNCFSNCNLLPKVTIPEGVEVIDTGAFESCRHLTDVTFPSTLKFIGEYAFAYAQFTTLELPEGLETIDDSAFFMCPNLKSVNIPSTVRTIGDWAFCFCPSLSAVSFLASAQLESIGANAFDSSPLELTLIPDSVKYIGEHALGYYYDDFTGSYHHYPDFQILCTKDSAGHEYAQGNIFPYAIYTVEPEPTTTATEPSSTATEPTATETVPTSTATEPVDTSTATEPQKPEYDMGDVNLDGNVNIKDATAIQKHIASILTLSAEALEVADFNGDGSLNIKDATAIQKFIAGII